MDSESSKRDMANCRTYVLLQLVHTYHVKLEKYIFNLWFNILVIKKT